MTKVKLIVEKHSDGYVRLSWVLSIAIATFCAFGTSHPAQAAVHIYFTGNDQNYTTGNIWRTQAGTNQIETIYTVGYDDGRPMMVHSFNRTLYWTTYYPGQLWSSGMGGENPQLLVDQGENTTTRAIQFKDDKVYWANEPLGAIYRANLDGTNVETVISGYFGYGEGFWDFEIYGNRIYWTSWDSSSVRSINLDGSDFQTININGVSRAFSIEVADDRLFLSDIDTGPFDRVVSADLNGGDVEELVSGLTELYSLDVFEGRLYYASLTFNPGLTSLIHSLPLDGGRSQLELEAPSIQLWQIHVVQLTGVATSLDIKPGSCPNPLNRNSHGMMPAAILGTDDFDAAQIDISSVLISRADGVGGSAAPNEGPRGPHTVLEDVGTPFDGEPCDCHALESDGTIDLLMHFRTQEVVESLELDDLPPDTFVEITVTGVLLDKTPFTANDCIRLVPAGDMDGDGAVGAMDLIMLISSWGSCAECIDCPLDLDGDCSVGAADLLTLLANWG